MCGPFIFVEAYEAWVQGLVQYVQANEPRMVAFNLYLNEAGTEVAAVQVHPDAASLQRHMEVVREYIETAYGEFLEEPFMILACGEGDDTRQMIQQLTPPGFPVVANAPAHWRPHSLR
jgi:hypothetical protein